MPWMDPNVVYLLLLIGLFTSALAVYIPGTGLWELIALAVLAAALYMLLALPTNWLSVLALIAGSFDFLMLPLYRRRLTVLALLGLVFQVGGSILLFNGLSVSWILIALTLGLSLLFYQYVLIPARMSRFHPPVQDDEQLLPGSTGRVVKSLDPLGTVHIRGELWTAYSDQPIQTGDSVVVLEKDGLRLHVEKAKSKRKPQEPLEEVSL
jgi:membrane-bound serine protease (ClpP class)